MGRHALGIVAAWVCTLIGAWVAVSAHALNQQPLDATALAVARSNLAAGIAVVALGALLGGLQVAALVRSERARANSGPPTAGPPPQGWSSSVAGPQGWPAQQGWSSPPPVSAPEPQEERPAREDEQAPRSAHPASQDAAPRVHEHLRADRS